MSFEHRAGQIYWGKPATAPISREAAETMQGLLRTEIELCMTLGDAPGVIHANASLAAVSTALAELDAFNTKRNP